MQTVKKTFYPIVFDNKGETLDRYTIVTKSGDIFGCSTMPFSPVGFAQYTGNVTDRLNITFGAGWHRGHTKANLKRILKSELDNYLNEARNNPNWLGIEVSIDSLNEDVQQYINQIKE